MTKNEHPWLNNYDEGVPSWIDIPKITLVDLLKQAVEDFREATCVIYQDQSISYYQLDMLSDRIARFLLDKGLQNGDRVGIFLPNSPAFVISYYGILKMGGVVMALNPSYRPVELVAQAIESGIKVLIIPALAYTEIKNIQAKTAIESLVVVGETINGLNTCDISWQELLAKYEKGDKVAEKVDPEDPAVFQYSGGTTGSPKCAIGLHRNLVANVFQFNNWLVNTEQGRETILVAIPIYHVYGMVLGMNLAVKMGARMVLIPDPRDLVSILESIEKYQATIFPGVPNIYAAINQYQPVLSGKYDLSSIKACISGSTTLPICVKHKFESLTNGHLVEGYGLSEAPTATHCNPILGENREGSIGLPLPNVACKVVDLETGEKELAIDEVGELIIRGPQVMSGYYQRPDETALALRNGWLYTGDVARMDEDGFFYLVDRKKDVIKVGGFQVWPNEVEEVIIQHPKVKEVAVAGVMDEMGAEAAKAWIILRDDQTCSPKEIQDFCKEFLTRYKIPKFIEFRDTLPRTMVGKVLRRVLSGEHHQGMNR